jgi:riboflavin-specific deaminase-like protein
VISGGDASAQRPGRPIVTVKIAQTLDGRVATASGHSQWVSGPESRRLAHRLRTENDAILAGVGTVIADDPLLTARLWPGPNPMRVIVDSRLRIPVSSALLHDGGKTLLATTTAASHTAMETLRATGAEITQLPALDARVDLRRLMDHLRSIEVRTVLIEGGPTVITALIRARLVDRVVIFIAPKLIGTGIDSIGDLGIQEIGGAIEVIEESIERAGADLVIRGSISWPQ